jgi:hypothetical protein
MLPKKYPLLIATIEITTMPAKKMQTSLLAALLKSFCWAGDIWRLGG